MKTGRMIGSVFLALLLATQAVAEEVPELLEPVGVKMDAVAAYVGDISNTLVYDAYVVPHVEELYFSQEGKAEEVNVIVGQEVKAGDVLVTLNQEKELERMETLRDEIAHIEMQSAFAERLMKIDLAILDRELEELRRQLPLDEKAIALKQLEREQMELDWAFEASLTTMDMQRLQTELAALEANTAKVVLTAPFDGQVVYLSALERGSYISAYTPVVYLADNTRLSIESAFISSSTLNRADKLYGLIGTQSCTLEPVAMDETDYISKVLAGETVMSKFTAADSNESLSAGQYVAVCLVTDLAEDVLIVPSNAVYADPISYYVYVVENGSRVRRDVTVGLITDWETQIREGLQEGEMVYVPE